MTDRDPKGPRLSAKGEAAQVARQARLAEALRANLHKRKAQSRGRSAEETAEAGAAAPGDAAKDG